VRAGSCRFSGIREYEARHRAHHCQKQDDVLHPFLLSSQKPSQWPVPIQEPNKQGSALIKNSNRSKTFRTGSCQSARAGWTIFQHGTSMPPTNRANVLPTTTVA
jgi:hypothetical protein